MSKEELVAWALLIMAAAAGTTMIVVATIEGIPGIVRSTIQRDFKWRRR
jgi:hypothetical protein